jgi:uncharacterized protein YdaU (DUF1376 family)
VAKSRKSPAFSFYPDAWVLGTLSMSFEEQGVYLRMLCFQWSHGPSDANAYANACGLAYRSHVERILSSKFERIGNVFANSRLEEEREKQQQRSDKARESASERWNAKNKGNAGESHANALPTHMRTHTETHQERICETDAKPMLSVSVSDSVSNTDTGSNKDPQTPKGATIAVEDFFFRWNRFAEKKPKVKPCRKLSSNRVAKISARLKASGWLDDFREAVKCLPLPGDGWQPNLDWLIRNDHNIYLILEGAFDWRGKDDPASQKLAIMRRKEAYAQRLAREEAEKLQRNAGRNGLHNAIASTLDQTDGLKNESSERSLLFG